MFGKAFDYLFLPVVVILGFVFDWWPGKDDVVRYYDAFVSFNWMPSRSYFEGYYDTFGGTVGGWLRQADDAIQSLLASSYGDKIRRGVVGYAVFAVICLLLPSYRKGMFELVHGDDFQFFAKMIGFFLILTALSLWSFGSAPGFQPKHLSNEAFSTLLVVVLTLIGLPSFLAIGFIVLSSVIWVPAVLFGLPGVVFLFVSFVLKVGFLFLISPFRALIFLWQSLRYLFVPHPAEVVYKAGMRDHVAAPVLAANVADALRKHDFIAFERLPPAWKSKNRERRISALCKSVKADNDFAQELIRHCRLKGALGDLQ